MTRHGILSGTVPGRVVFFYQVGVFMMKKFSIPQKVLSVPKQTNLFRSREIKFSDMETAKKFLSNKYI